MSTNKQILVEGLKYMDMEGQLVPYVGVDEFKSTVGSDDDLITLNFVAKSKAVAEDLAEWFERGYDCVVDAAASPGEVTEGKWFVFVEMNRRQTAPKDIMEMIEDLETLTGLKPSEWKMKIADKKAIPSSEFIKDSLEISPHEYRLTHGDQALNEWREIAGIPTVSTYENDEAIRAIKRQAGIY